MKHFSQFNWISQTYINVRGKKNVNIILLELMLHQDKIVYMMFVIYLRGIKEKKVPIVLIIFMVYIAVNF